MGLLNLSVCYFPTTVVFVDDNQNFLTTLSLKLDTTHIIPRLFFDPISAVQYLQTEYQENPFTNRCLSPPTHEDPKHHNAIVNLQAISQEIYNPLRYAQISVVVVDYAMPSLNGLDFARQLKTKDNHFKILMLTGAVDETLAIQAFNEGVIDQFIRKDSLDFQHETNAVINNLQHRYFQDLSNSVFNNASHTNLTIPILQDPVFIKAFNQICQDNQITEYYLTDAQGGFLLLNFDGTPSCLVAKNDADQADKLTSPEKKLAQDQLSNYSLIQDLKDYPILPEKIFSCRGYLDEAPF